MGEATMQRSLGVVLFINLVGIALFGVGLAYSNTSFVAPGIAVLVVGIMAAIVMLGRHVSTIQIEEQPTQIQIQNPVMKKNKSDTDLELLSEAQDAT